MDMKIFLGVLPVAVGVATTIFYIRETLQLRIKPHAFTWLIWGVTTAIAFTAQVIDGAGAGAWFTGYASFWCFVMFGLAIWKGDRTFSVFDWICLFAALLSLIPWWLTNNPTLSVIFVTFIDACGYLPTYKKIFKKPWEESIAVFGIANFQYLSSMFALSAFTLSTVLYPLMCVVMNTGVVVILLIGRRMSKKPRPT